MIETALYRPDSYRESYIPNG